MSKPNTRFKLSPEAQQQGAIVEMERALIGALIQFSSDGLNAQKQAFEAIHPYSRADIYNENNLVIFSSVTSMIVANELCTVELLHKRLADLNRLNDVGGLGVIAGLCNDGWSYNTPDKLKALSGELIKESRRRKTYELETIVRQGLEVDGRTVDEVLSDVQARINLLTARRNEAKFKLSAWRDISAPKPVNWLINGVIEADSLACLYGASGCGKSFLAVDLSLCIASGHDWHGHKVQQGSVAYFAGEGLAGLRRRIAAWLQSSNADTGKVDNHFLLADKACLLPDDTDDVISALRDVPDLRLMVLDTLNRTMAGDENSTRDMTAYIQACDKIRTAIPNLTVLLIHHTGHAASDRARGNSALKASLDIELCATMRELDGRRVVTIEGTKSKDAEPLVLKAFSLSTVELAGWRDDEGRPMASATLTLTDAAGLPLSTKGDKAPKGANQQKALTVLMALTQYQKNNLSYAGYEGSEGVLYVDWERDCIRQGIARKPSGFKERILLKLQEAGIVKLDAPYIRLLE